MVPDAAYWIEKLSLTNHPEGGAFKELYRSPLTIQTILPGKSVSVERNVCTSIYFLLQEKECSCLHRIASDELWHFYAGSGLTVFEIEASSGKLVTHELGLEADQGKVFQTVIKAGNWFGARVGQGPYALAGCTVAPGFDFDDFEMGDREKLTAQYPQHRDLIISLTR